MITLAKKTRPNVMVILDGWGMAPAWGGNAITSGKTPAFDKIWKSFPKTTLLASGEAVGLPANSPGNSEAGHLNIGAGRIVHQDITLIDQKIADGSFFNNPVLTKAWQHALTNNSSIHLIGLLSETGTHSHVRHLYALLEFFKQKNFNKVFIHLISDGRDSDPMDGISLGARVEEKVKEIGVGKIVSLIGRFFAMDRDNRWERVIAAYNLYIGGEGIICPSLRAAFSTSYSKNQMDEFISPTLIVNEFQQKVNINDNDTVIFFNFRPDRTKELTQAFLAPLLPNMPRRKILKNLFFANFAMYMEKPLGNQVFEPEKVVDPIASVWASNNLKQFHVAETEKYPHVTYFLNGGVERPFPGERRFMVPSVRNVKTYDQKPEMSAKVVTTTTLDAIKAGYDLTIVNFANPDMVGHTGNLRATIKAVEFVDLCLNSIIKMVIDRGNYAFILADHGNAEQMVNPRTGEKDTEHTTNPVPFIIVSSDPQVKKIKLKSDGVISSVAPTILDVLNYKKPDLMRNESLIINQLL